jgi:membrane protease YdiL (CAAX protease family)
LGLLIGCGAISTDMALTWEGRADYLGWRLVVSLVAASSFRFLLHVDRPSLGLRLSPVQGWSYWIRATCWIATVMGAVLLLLASLATLVGLELPIPRQAPTRLGSVFLHGCVLAPLVEEITYRLVLCSPSAACFGPAATIGTSGVVFALLHVLYGNPAPDNAIAGFVLGWAYLKSGSLLIPSALHSLGNLFVISLQIGAWYVMGPAT